MVKIGHVELDLRDHYPSTAPHLIPKFYLPHDYHNVSPTILSHLQWILSKDVLGQDMMLVGPPGSGAGERRQLALMYAEMTRREVEILTISADVTESDLKQRKELVVVRKSNNTNHNANTTATATATATTVEFQDQAPVRAALHGRLLILDGLEKAERNVLPTLNNLLENREMNLDDGRLLVSPKRYQDLRLQHDPGFLVPIHPSFRVVALTTPAPPFPGKGLDPPLRSRFQIRRVDSPSAEELYQELSLSLPTALTNDENGTQDYHRICQTFSAFGAAMNSATMKSFSSSSSGGRTLVFPTNTLQASAQILQTFPHENPRNLLARSYPFCNTAKLQMGSNNDADASKRSFKRACDELHIGGGSLDDPDQFWDSTYNIQSIERSRDNPRVANVAFLSSTDASIVEAQVACGTNKLNRLSPSRFVQTEGTQSVLVSMIQEHSVARDILLVSPRGEGKSTIAKQFASMLGYNMLVFNLYKEMTARDLLQRRSTDPISGETKWEDSALVKAACAGDLCILDGVERIGSDTFATLHSLLTERELSLPDGTRLVRSDRAVDSAASLNNNKVRPIHSSFRVIALASLSASKHVYSSRNYKWLSDDVMSMTSILSVPTPSLDCMKAILSSANPNFPESVINKLLLLRTTLVEDDTALDCGVQPLSTRNLLRIVRLQNNNNNNNSTHTDAKDLYGAIGSVLLADLLPPTQRAALDTILNNHGIIQSNSKRDGSKHPYSLEQIEINENKVSIGNVAFQRHCNVRRPEMVPKPEFVDIPNQIHAIKGLLKEMNAGERAFLLLGNQGVGKNKITDRLCEVANLEREYVQLHRDSTIGSLTLSPSLEDGKIIWKDSPLIRAVQDGVVLVVDEADKAPLEVVAVLKSLVEDGELLLADGRRISRYEKGDGIIEMHPDFTLFVLANRPGYPFHGNDSFREIGDCFSVQVIANPDLESEMSLLRKYAPDIGNSLIRQIASSFDHLRGMADHGDISYPYSTREAVAVVKHLQAYPDDGVVAAIHNVLDFDSFDDSTYSIIGGVFNHHGIQMSSYSSWRVAQARLRAAASERGLEIEYTKQRETEGVSSSPPLLSSPHKGRWDDKNEAHVGGNQVSLALCFFMYYFGTSLNSRFLLYLGFY